MARKKKIVEANEVNIADIKYSTDKADVTNIEFENVNIVVRYMLTFEECVRMASDIASSCYNDEGKYTPIAFDLAVGMNILCRYGNFKMSDDLDAQYKIVVDTDIIDKIKEHICIKQLDNIIDSAKKMVEQMCFEHANYAIAKINELSEQINSIANSVKELFEGISQTDLNNIVNAIGANGIDTDKIVESYIKSTENKVENVVGM